MVFLLWLHNFDFIFFHICSLWPCLVEPSNRSIRNTRLVCLARPYINPFSGNFAFCGVAGIRILFSLKRSHIGVLFCSGGYRLFALED